MPSGAALSSWQRAQLVRVWAPVTRPEPVVIDPCGPPAQRAVAVLAAGEAGALVARVGPALLDRVLMTAFARGVQAAEVAAGGVGVAALAALDGVGADQRQSGALVVHERALGLPARRRVAGLAAVTGAAPVAVEVTAAAVAERGDAAHGGPVTVRARGARVAADQRRAGERVVEARRGDQRAPAGLAVAVAAGAGAGGEGAVGGRRRGRGVAVLGAMAARAGAPRRAEAVDCRGEAAADARLRVTADAPRGGVAAAQGERGVGVVEAARRSERRAGVAAGAGAGAELPGVGVGVAGAAVGGRARVAHGGAGAGGAWQRAHGAACGPSSEKPAAAWRAAVNREGDHALTSWQRAHAPVGVPAGGAAAAVSGAATRGRANWPPWGSSWQASHAGLPRLKPGDAGGAG